MPEARSAARQSRPLVETATFGARLPAARIFASSATTASSQPLPPKKLLEL
jgi:hypothetical protein